MYQATHPDVTLTPMPRSPTFALGGNGPDDLSTPLYPFRHPNGQEWRSNDIRFARRIHDYGYSYPEVPPNLAQPDLSAFTTRRINELYRPNLASSEFKSLNAVHEDSNLGRKFNIYVKYVISVELNNARADQLEEELSRLEWSCNVQYDMRELSGPSYSIMFYLDSDGSQNVVGAASIFAGVTTSVDMPDTKISVDVPLTSELLQPAPNLSPSSVVPVLIDQLYWKIERVNDDGSITTVPVEEIPSLKIATFSTMANYPADMSQLPQKGNETLYLNPTKDKDGGLDSTDDVAVFINSISDDDAEIVE